ncbi:Protein CBG25535 [Caenorhabditis briggsae]|uniref:Protein CBG25535 n=1 Tax=Caenorhabditis briggsae TaxID=6238 RepID=B6IIQ7_CAEBR|nr:Protein CBG25535 [Caenorhabditis briggsae]CAR99787.1 Protein CBG25535 [Caenorhabditis briggsae]
MENTPNSHFLLIFPSALCGVFLQFFLNASRNLIRLLFCALAPYLSHARRALLLRMTCTSSRPAPSIDFLYGVYYVS